MFIQSIAFSLASEITGMQVRTTASSGIMGYISQYWIALLVLFIAGFIIGFGFRFIKWGV